VNAARSLLVASAAALLLVADYVRRQLGDGEDLGGDPDWTDQVNAMAAEARNALTGSDVAGMRPSANLVGMLKRGERLVLTRYELGDGGWTIGYGRFYPHNGPMPPERIDEYQAEAWFNEDIEARAARWVRAYVTVPLAQHQFDALVHMAFNLSPKSFRTIAAEVNAGNDPEAAAMKFIRAGTNLERGLRNRRAKELNLYRSGIYA
jgi:lysozyme